VTRDGTNVPAGTIECVVRSRPGGAGRTSGTVRGALRGAIAGLEPVTGEHRQVRIAREARIRPGELAEQEARPAGGLDDPGVDAAAAQARRPADVYAVLIGQIVGRLLRMASGSPINNGQISVPVPVAERVGFEPTEPCDSAVFKFAHGLSATVQQGPPEFE
jgi:hypothetical protein